MCRSAVLNLASPAHEQIVLRCHEQFVARMHHRAGGSENRRLGVCLFVSFFYHRLIVGEKLNKVFTKEKAIAKTNLMVILSIPNRKLI